MSDNQLPPSGITAPEWSVSKLEGLPFETRESDRPRRGINMPGNYWVEEGVIRSTFKTYWAHARKYSRDTTYTAEKFFRDPDWEDRNRGEKLKIGRCFKYFAANGVLPIYLVESNTPTLRYRLTADGKPAA